MLVLTRGPGESIIITTPAVAGSVTIQVKVLNIAGNQIRIGVEAPNTTAIHREEIYDAIKVQENAKAD